MMFHALMSIGQNIFDAAKFFATFLCKIEVLYTETLNDETIFILTKVSFHFLLNIGSFVSKHFNLIGAELSTRPISC